jgi:hypothetical protein
MSTWERLPSGSEVSQAKAKKFFFEKKNQKTSLNLGHGRDDAITQGPA